MVFYSLHVCVLILQRYPDAEVPLFRTVVAEFFEACMRLSLAILEAMGHALKLKVSNYGSGATIQTSE